MAKKEIEKRVKNAILYTDGSILIQNVRFSYPRVGHPAEETDDEGKVKGKSYSVTGLCPKSTHGEVKALIVDIMKKILADNKVKDLPSDKKFFKDGDKAGKLENEGMWTFSAREKKRPKARNEKAEPFADLDETDELIYGGAWGNVLINPWWQNHPKFGKRINANFLAIQLTKGLDAGGNPKPGAEPFGKGGLSDDDVDEIFDATEDDGDAGFDDDDMDGL